MICSSVNLVRFIVRPQVGPDSNRIWRKNPGAGHPDNTTGTDPYVLGQIDAKVSHLLESSRTQRDDFRRMAEDIHKRLDGYDVRISKVEHSSWRIADKAMQRV